MKSIAQNLIFAVCGVFFLVSCHNDDEVTNPLLGTWILKAITTQNCKDQSQNITMNYDCDDFSCRKYIFIANGALKVEQFENGPTSTMEGTYTISNGTVIANITAPSNSSTVKTYTFTVSGSALYLQEIVQPFSGKCSSTTVMLK